MYVAVFWGQYLTKALRSPMVGGPDVVVYVLCGGYDVYGNRVFA
jgi:hypothetical protein